MINEITSGTRNNPSARGAVATALSEGPLWLNVGSGLALLPGYVNLDTSIYLRLAWLSSVSHLIFGAEKAEYFRKASVGVKDGSLRLHDCRRSLPYGNDSVDHILASHILEHVYPDQAVAMLREFIRVLHPAGTLHIIVPDLRKLAIHYLESDQQNAADEFISSTIMSHGTRRPFRYRILELLAYEGLQHRWMYDGRSMSGLISRAGFEVVESMETPSSMVRLDCPESVHLFGRKPRSTQDSPVAPVAAAA